MLTQQAASFLAARTRMVRVWRPVGVFLLLLWFSSVAWLVYCCPLVFNPWVALARMKAGTYELATLQLSSVLLPIVSLLCLGIVLVIILFLFVAFQHERQYLGIIAGLRHSHIVVDDAPQGDST